mmetsp:Transcript_42874/g.85971  ORF Transcript_42874/g.85971 Transcript_42874/m.85971 type:complete len:207 (+) Transcript_42874:156-776(+)
MARVIRFAHIGLAVSNVAEAESFYAKVGYRRVWPYRPGVLVNSGGLELHMMQAEKPSPAAGNVLMDMPDDAKFPGINHMSFGVRSVLATRTYLEGSGIEISGTRANLAVFVRDPDRTVLEFERNDGGNEDGLVVTADVLSAVPRGGIDHVGIRVSNPRTACFQAFSTLLSKSRTWLLLLLLCAPTGWRLSRMLTWARSDSHPSCRT